MLLILLTSLVTSILGAVKNVVKYKKFNFLLFTRTPLLVIPIYKIISFFMTNISTIILLSLLLERWFMFIYKIIVAYKSNNYLIKKEKYKVKYGIKY